MIDVSVDFLIGEAIGILMDYMSEHPYSRVPSSLRYIFLARGYDMC